MATVILTDLQNFVLDRLQANVSTDPPLATVADPTGLTTLNRFVNDAYADIWEIAGTSVTKANHATLWTPSPAISGTMLLTGQLQNFKELLHLYLSTTVGSTGMTAGDVELDRMELPELLYRRGLTALYANTKSFAVERPEPAAATDVNKVNIHLYPASTATQYFPAHYVTPKPDLSAGSDAPDVTELEARDIALIAAARIAPLIGRAEFVPGLLADISERTANALKGRLRALLNPKLKPDEATT